MKPNKMLSLDFRNPLVLALHKSLMLLHNDSVQPATSACIDICFSTYSHACTYVFIDMCTYKQI